MTRRVSRRVHGRLRHVVVKGKKAIAPALAMPTTIAAQNGAVIHQTTQIAVAGCSTPKAKKAKRKRRKRANTNRQPCR